LEKKSAEVNQLKHLLAEANAITATTAEMDNETTPAAAVEAGVATASTTAGRPDTTNGN